MADGFATSFLPALSRLIGEVEQPTDTRGMMSPQFGGSPEQLMSFLQSPDVQERMGKMGVHFDPANLRQSPFLPNQFMQGHPLLGHMLTGAMANAAATPEAPLVSGAGSGISRAMQGMYGGPEMLRQYQVRQMLAPFQAMGAQIPGMEFQRKQELLGLLTKMEEDRQKMAQQGMTEKAREFNIRTQQDEGVMRGGPRFNQLTGETWIPHAAQQAQPQGQPQPQAQTEAGAGMPAVPGTEGLVSPMAPGTPATPYQPAGYTKEQADLDRIGDVASQKETEAQKQQRLGAGARGQAAAELARRKGEDPAIYMKFAKQFNDERDKWNRINQRISELELTGQYTPEQLNKMRADNDSSFEEAKKTIDAARGAGQGGKASSQPWQRPAPATVNPGASPGSAQQGGAGSQKSEGTAIAPAAQVPGLPAGYILNEQGIPVPAPRQ